MSTISPVSKLLQRVLLYGLLALIAWMMIRAYLIVRTERIRTSITMHLSTGEHEIIVALPKGSYHIQFTADLKGATSGIIPPANVLPAQITTRLVREDGEPILKPTAAEYIAFSIPDADSFQPERLLVSISSTQACQVYMNLRAGF